MDAPDGRQECPSVLDGWETRIDPVLARFDDPRLRGEAEAAVETTIVHDVLQREFGLPGSYQSVRRYLSPRRPPQTPPLVAGSNSPILRRRD